MEIIQTADATAALAAFTGVITDNIPVVLVIAGTMGGLFFIKRALSKNLKGKAGI